MGDHPPGQGQADQYAEPPLPHRLGGFQDSEAGALIGDFQIDLLRGVQRSRLHRHLRLGNGHHQGLLQQQVQHHLNLLGVPGDADGLLRQLQGNGEVAAGPHRAEFEVNLLQHLFQVNQPRADRLEILLQVDQVADVVRDRLQVGRLLLDRLEVRADGRVRQGLGVLGGFFGEVDDPPHRRGQLVGDYRQGLRLQFVAALQFLVGRLEVQQGPLNFLVFPRDGPFLGFLQGDVAKLVGDPHQPAVLSRNG